MNGPGLSWYFHAVVVAIIGSTVLIAGPDDTMNSIIGGGCWFLSWVFIVIGGVQDHKFAEGMLDKLRVHGGER
jgi:hypothetical protein